MEPLKTNYKNDLYTGKRIYKLTNVDTAAGTVNLDDVTKYQEVGDIYSAADINTTNRAVNEFYDEYTSRVNKVEGTIIITLPIANWSGSAPYTQTVVAGAVKATDVPVPGLIYPSAMTESQKAQIDKSVNMITKIETQNGSVKVTCKFKKPVTDITLSLKGVV